MVLVVPIPIVLPNLADPLWRFTVLQKVPAVGRINDACERCPWNVFVGKNHSVGANGHIQLRKVPLDVRTENEDPDSLVRVES